MELNNPVQAMARVVSEKTRAKRGQVCGPLLDPEELKRYENLWIFAKATVESFYAGKHLSPYRGGAAEFAEYKSYAVGDAVSRVDWRVYGRTRRLYVRQFDQETDTRVYLFVDMSASMRFSGRPRASKYAVAAKIAAALAYLSIAQGDKAALVLFSDTITTALPPGGTRRHLNRLMSELESAQPENRTGLGHALSQCQTLLKKRGRIVILSDFFDDLPVLFDALAQLLHRRFEILLLQVLDAQELELPAMAVARFVDMETGEAVKVDSEEIREGYQQEVARRIAALAAESDRHRIEHRLLDTGAPYVEALEAYLGLRGKPQRSH